MKIAVDVRLLQNPNSGMGIYLSEVLSRLKSINGKNDYYYLDYKLPKVNLLEKILDLIYEQLWIQLLVPILLKHNNIKLLYSPNPPTSLLVNVPIVLTIPDLSFCFDPEMNWFIKKYLYWIYRLSALKAKKITTFSESSKKDIVSILNIEPDKIEIVSPAVKDVFRLKLVSSKLKQVRKKFGIRKKYILSVPGTFIFRKNVIDLLLGFNDLPPKIRQGFNLVFIGNNKNHYFKDFLNKVKKMKLENCVIITGYVSEEEIKALYQGAFMLVITSLYEGFGLPPLEAMQQSVPVIAYDNSSLSEIVGQAGLKVKDQFALKQAILNIIKNNKLRDELVKKGLRQVKKYNWNKSVYKLLQIFQAGNDY